MDYARSVLMRSLGEDRADEIIGRLAATIERRPFEFLRRTPAEQIVVFLRNESPQTIALVISNLHTALAAQVLSDIEPEYQADVALRIAMMAETRPEVVSQVEAVMRSRLTAVGSQEYAAAGGVKSLADILNSSDRTTERNVLDELAKATATAQRFAKNIREGVRRIRVSPDRLGGLPADFVVGHQVGDDGLVELTTEYPGLPPGDHVRP